ncbi:4-carboxymuconolactone decarboxylase [Cupriavidus sp. OV038]|jgi:4-carboxymuconolactone decarboxylase|uniref:carboxymuconolactone decarboxylase family protein n=1 Tax=unclassified Cupriavidus TaxID=2640874 RepID=UPI0008E598C6|nr:MULTISPECIES: carboxymuconolactone decarboxylase family protein [unclassified Cupriavidus]SFC39866.1 4-carboxymuconolactone decarboxylase [Cupriavidus sp. OV038]SFP29954.1 4-carboxymuconolactone decarboxylase [Cupriavidus sp. OV096]
MPRIPNLALDAMTPAQRAVHDTIAGGPRGGVRGPLAVWLQRPQLAATAQALGQYCRYDSSLPPRLSELAILCMARAWRAEYEWYAHKPLALKAGVQPEVVEAIRTGRTPAFANEDEAVVHAVMQSLDQTRRIPDTLYKHAIDVLGQDGVVDLVGLAGYYTLISMTINAFEVVPPEGTPSELDPL